LAKNKGGTMNELALFAGAGGGILGGHLLGWRTVCAVEWEPYAACILAARQNDGLLPHFPIWDDVQTFDGKPWRGIVDVVSGGFPCQDISAAGKGAGIDGERSGMWREMARIICEVRPRFVFVENSPMLTSRGLGVVLGDLAKMGFDAKWGVLGAADVGAPHQRDRIWIAGWRDIFPHTELHRLGWREQQSEGVEETQGNVADTTELLCNGRYDNTRISVGGKSVSKPRNSSWSENVADTSDQGLWSCVRGNGGELDNQDSRRGDFQGRSGSNVEPSEVGKPQNMEKEVPNTDSSQCQGNKCAIGIGTEYTNISGTSWWETEPDVGRVVDGVASRVDRLKAIGNGQVPLVAATAWEGLSEQR
jgi:DNA (cytosine-5)-methyltransferase 1